MNLEIPDRLDDQVAHLYRYIADMERRFQNRDRKGKILSVDAAAGLAKVQLDDDPVTGEKFEVHDVPWEEVAHGAIKTFFPPSPGEIVSVQSQSGDLADAVIKTSLPSNANPRPHDKEREGVVTVGNVRWHIKDGEATTTVGDSTLITKSDSIGIKTRALTIDAETVTIRGTINHTGDTTQNGVHIDSLGRHST